MSLEIEFESRQTVAALKNTEEPSSLLTATCMSLALYRPLRMRAASG